MIAESISNQGKIVFRVDATPEIGGGHFQRCVAIAEQAVTKGWDVVFVSRTLSQTYVSQLTLLGIKLCTLNAADDDHEMIKLQLRSGGPVTRILVVDNYGLGGHWESKFFFDAIILVIDDLVNRPHFCHALLDANFRSDYGDLYRNLVPQFCARFLGPKYAILKRDFLDVTVAQEGDRNGLLVFFGSADSAGATLTFIEAALKSDIKFRINILCSSANVFISQLRTLNLPEQIQIHIDSKQIPQLMNHSKLYFGSGGTITWERTYLNLPGVVIAVADNQADVAKELADAGYQHFLGTYDPKKMDHYLEIVAQYFETPESLVKFQVASRGLVAPLNISDLVHNLQSNVYLRNASIEDARFLYELRTEPETASNSINQNQFSYESHLTWLTRRLSLENNLLLIATLNKDSVGMLRIDADGTVSIAVHPNARGKGLSKQMLLRYIEYREFTRSHGAPQVPLRALVRKNNEPSLKLFLSAGFLEVNPVEVGGDYFRCFELI